MLGEARLPAPTLEQRDRSGPPDQELEPRAQTLGEHLLTVRLLVNRGLVELDTQKRWLNPALGQLRPPTDMAGFQDALALLLEAREQGWRVGVFGDYDVDGVCTATILSTYLEAVGFEVVARVASREAGYGLGLGDCRALAEAGVQLVLLGDLGTSDVESLTWLREQGIKTAVIDHHQVPTTPPPTDAFINPHQAGCGFAFKGLCSAGVAFYLCAGLRTELAKRKLPAPDPRAWLDLVALATVCDMMPLQHENRVLVHAGLRHLARRTRPGVSEMLRQAGVEADEPLNEDHIGFKLGPRLNAPGRLGGADPSLRVLRARSRSQAQPLAEQIEALNARRKRHTERTVAEAMALLAADPGHLDRAGLVVAHDDWVAGVVGIAAGGLAERFDRPVAVVAIDRASGEARGSVRSAGGVDVRAALEACAPLLRRFGGHREAAGLSLAAQHVDAFVEAFDQAVAEQRADLPQMGDRVRVDCELELRSVTEALCTAIGRAGPFGMGFDKPKFILRGAKIERLRVLKERHLALRLSQAGEDRREAIAFGQVHPELVEGKLIDCVFVPMLDRFRGETRLKLHVERIWAHAL